ncbi:MAG: 2-oxo acid dehydrogenase subunit E2, partial [Phycisphaerae bacterium]
MATTSFFELRIPNLGESISEATLANWVKAEGQAVKADVVVAELETDKAAVELVAGQDGVLHIKVPKGATVAVGQLVAQVDPAGTPSAGSPPAAVGAGLAPAARRIVEESRLDPSKIVGTGKDGRITKEDVLAAVAKGSGGAGGGGPAQPADSAAAANVHRDQPTQAMSAPGTTAVYASPTPENTPRPVAGPVVGNAGGGGGDRRVEMSKLRQTIARRLVESNQQSPHCYSEMEVDRGACLKLREELNARLQDQAQPAKLSFNDFVLKACAEAMRKVPSVNASFEDEAIRQHGSVHLAFGVAIPGGLITP